MITKKRLFKWGVPIINYKKDVEYHPNIYNNLQKRFKYSIKSLKSKKILLVGAGTLGNEITKNLILSGVQHLTIVDMEIYVIENLPRSTLITEEDIQKSKSERLSLRAIEKSPFSLEIDSIHADITKMGFGFLDRFDLVITGVDNIAARYWVNHGCVLLGISHITLGTANLGDANSGNVVYIPGNVECACLECIWGSQLRNEMEKRLKCSDKDEINVIQPQVMTFSSIIAGIASNLAIQILTVKNIRNEAFQLRTSNNGVTQIFTYKLGNNCFVHKNLHSYNISTINIKKNDSFKDLYQKLKYILGYEPLEKNFQIDLKVSEVHFIVYRTNKARSVLFVDFDDESKITEENWFYHDHIYKIKDSNNYLRIIIK